jgi:hypothetical protein
MFRRWAEGTLQGMLGAILLSLIPGAAVAYLAHIRSVWTMPVLLGLCAAAVTMVIVLAADAIRRLPPRRVIPSIKNIETCVRDWLNNFQCSVKKSPVDIAYFRYLVTVDSGTKMLIGRTKGDFQDYIQIRSDISPGTDDLKKLSELTDLERAVVLGNIRLDLARRHVGYRLLAISAEGDSHVFKRIPIRETLTEHEFIAAMDEVEAAVHSVGLVFALELVKTGKFTPEEERKELDTAQ